MQSKSERQIQIDRINSEIEQIQNRIPGMRLERDQQALQERIQDLIAERDAL